MPNNFGGDQLDEDYTPVQAQEAREREALKEGDTAKCHICSYV